MLLCSVDEVRARVYTTTLTDIDILDIITEVSEEVLDRVESTDISDTALRLAGKYAAYAATLRRMRNTGEAATNIKQGNSQQQNTIDADIQYYDKKSEFYIQKYITTSSFGIVSGRMGYGTVNDELP